MIIAESCLIPLNPLNPQPNICRDSVSFAQ